MKCFGKSGFSIIFLVFTIFTISGFSADSLKVISPTYFNEQNNVYEDINFLKNEILSLEFCTDKPAENIEINLICEDGGKDIRLETYEKIGSNNCKFTNYDLVNICDEFKLEVSYETSNKAKKFIRNFVSQKQSKLINHVLSLDPEVLDDTDLSYFLIVQNDLENVESELSQYAYERLKNNRNNNDKCWPTSSCKIDETSEILRNLELADYPTDSRLLEDGLNYLEQNRISNENNPVKFDITVDNDFVSGEEVICEVKIDDEDELSYTFRDNNEKISKYASEYISVSCNQTVELIEIDVFNYNGKLQENLEYENARSASKSVEPFSCIGSGSSCNFDSTIATLTTFGNSFDDSNLLENYIDSLVIEEDDDSDIKYLDTSNIYEGIGKFLFHKNNNDLSDYLKFNQNNKGSWGSSSIYNDILKTSWAVLGLQEVDSDSEYVDDGKKWIYFNEPSSGWGDVKKNTLAYLAIKEQIKPYLRLTSKNEISELTKFTITNPTIHSLKDVKVKLSDNLNEYVSYTESLGELNGDETIEFEIMVNPNFYSELSGELIISGVTGKNSNVELIKIPINLVGPQPITLVSGNYSLTPDVPILEVEILKNVPKFDLSCKYKNPFDGADENASLNHGSKTLQVSNFALKQGSFNLNVECDFQGNKFETSALLNISIAEKSFETITSYSLDSLEDFSFSINDTTNARQTLTFEITGTYKGLVVPAEKEKLLGVGDVRDLYFKVANPLLLETYGNQSVGDIVIKSTTGYKKKIPIVYNVGVQNENEGLAWWSWILILLGVSFVGLVAFRFYEMKYMHNEGDNSNGELADDEFYFE